MTIKSFSGRLILVQETFTASAGDSLLVTDDDKIVALIVPHNTTATPKAKTFSLNGLKSNILLVFTTSDVNEFAQNLPTGEIAEQVGATVATTSAIITKLRNAGFMTGSRNCHSLTPKGKSMARHLSKEIKPEV